jgi:uncharacterized protein YlxW (UPF0749 family)
MTDAKHQETGLGWPTGTQRTVPPPADVPVAADEAPSAEEPVADVTKRRRLSSAGVVIGVLFALFGFALVVQLKSTTGDSQLDSARPEDLVRILSDLNAREERLRTEISALQVTRNQLQSGVQGREAALAAAKRRADELGILAGTLPARGEGLRLRLVPGGTSPIRAATVLDAVEELRGAGAEALQIAGGNGAKVRIVASTYFVDAPGGGLVVDGQTLAVPYTIDVIGPAQTMRTALTIPGGVNDAVARDGGNVQVDEPDTVHVDALHEGDDLRWARPVS